MFDARDDARALIVSRLAAIFFQPPPSSLHARGISTQRSLVTRKEREREREREKLAILAFPSFLQLSFRLAIEFRILQLRARSDAICRVRSDWPEEGGAAGGAIFN